MNDDNTSRARRREIARNLADGAYRVADAVKGDMSQSQSGPYNDGITCLVEAITSLATAVKRLADVSEEQDQEIDELREQVGAA
jgi:hypothetical protein